MKRKIFTPFAKAQAFGLIVGTCLALLALLRLDLDLRLFLVASAGAWLAWEFFLGPRAPSHSNSLGALSYALATGFAFPWAGLSLTALAAWAAP
jgi:hypothetical protein